MGIAAVIFLGVGFKRGSVRFMLTRRSSRWHVAKSSRPCLRHGCVGLNSRESLCPSAICSGVISFSNRSRKLLALSLP